MCQLLAMNCNIPTDIVFSFEGFSKRGGLTDNHSDGFGIAFFEEKGIRVYQDDQSSVQSPVAELIYKYPIHSKNVISHIRRATQGKVSLANTHPFFRELWGNYWVFAHNGHLTDFNPPKGQYYRTVGVTDSEEAFCFILENLRQKYDEKPSIEIIFKEISLLVHELRQKGIFNFVLSNGEWLIAHSNTLLFYKIRQAPFGEAQLLDEDLKVDFSKVTTPNDKVAVIATLPLTKNEKWSQIAENELILFKEGEIILRDQPKNLRYLTIEEGRAIARAHNVTM